MPQRIINLGEIRDILKGWDEVRQHILSGGVQGFALTIADAAGNESVYHAGLYKNDAIAAAKASLRMSWVMERAAGSPP